MPEIMEKIQHLLAPQPTSYIKKKEYKMIKTIGQGTFGMVRLALKLNTKEEVAIKVILKNSMGGSADFVRRELDAIQKYQHENIVPYLDWFESKDKYYMVFKLCKGGELFDRLIERGKFTETNCKLLICQVLKAVEYLHQNNLIHRDIKPENLLFETESDDSKLLLTDFGISKMIKDEEELLTTLCGSRGYVAPEILLRNGHGKPADMWSIGILTYLLLSGINPFRSFEQDNSELITAMLEEKFHFKAKCWTSISDEAKDFISNLLRGDPRKRITATEALAHKWITDGNVSDYNLLDHFEEEFNARAAYRRAFNKLKAVNILMHLASSTESLHNSDYEQKDKDSDHVDKNGDADDNSIDDNHMKNSDGAVGNGVNNNGI
ncbi:Pkinase-domain-containing protein [Neoconidiobolus thromboides FSU 785]|nr:Pkinase-domain-containing protein [Neoconidiobolus thromboides FSU 785]